MNPHSASDPAGSSAGAACIRAAACDELPAINAIITRAVLAWPMAERLKLVALKVLRYDRCDWDDLQMLVGDVNGRPSGVAVWDAQTPYSDEAGRRGALLHGLYVLPTLQRTGIGAALQRHVARAAAARGFHGLLVKAERVSVSYFERCGYERLPAQDAFGVSYPYLFWHGFSRQPHR